MEGKALGERSSLSVDVHSLSHQGDSPRHDCRGARRSIESLKVDNYSQLFIEALADVESGVQHPCSTTEHCCEIGGCPRCFRGMMRGNIEIEHIEVFTDSGIVRITTGGCGHPTPCTVCFRGVSVTVRKWREPWQI